MKRRTGVEFAARFVTARAVCNRQHTVIVVRWEGATVIFATDAHV